MIAIGIILLLALLTCAFFIIRIDYQTAKRLERNDMVAKTLIEILYNNRDRYYKLLEKYGDTTTMYQTILNSDKPIEYFLN